MKALIKAVNAILIAFILATMASCDKIESNDSGQKIASVKPLADEIETGFNNPPPQARPYVWWHWMNGNITRHGITADLEAMAKSGIGGAWIFNIAGPLGCNIAPGPVDYMSDEWLELFKFAAMEADRLGLKLGFHNCAGWATMGGPWIEPRDGMQKLVSTVIKIEGGKIISEKLPQPETTLGFYRDIAVFAFPTPKNEAYRVHQWPQKSGQRASRMGRQPDLKARPADAAIALDTIIDVTGHFGKDSTLTWDAPKGSWTILRLGHTPTGKVNHPAADSGCGLEVDKLKREGVDVHWQKGIMPLLDKLGPLAGKSFNNILIDSYEAGLNHWTPRMREEFKKRRGYDPTPYLLALTGRLVEDGPTTDRFYWDFRRTISELFTDNFYGYTADLCHKEGIEFSTEPYTSCFEGLAVAAKADLPMGEFWVTRGYSHTLKLASSIAHTNGRNLSAAESFTAAPEVGKWQNYPGKIKSVGDYVWTQGINRFVLHAFVHQPFANDKVPGMTFGQWGTHFDRNVTWFKPGSAWFKYIARSQFLLQYGDFGADVLAFAGEAAPNGAANIKGLKEAGYDFDSCGTNIFAELKVDNGDIVLPCGKRYRLLVMPNTPFQAPHIAHKVRDLVAAGATVLSPKPQNSPTLSGFPASGKEVLAIADEVWGNCDGKAATSNKYGKGKVFAGISAIEVLGKLNVPPVVKLPSEIAWIHRTAPGKDVFFLSNQSDKSVKTVASFLAAGREPEFFDAEKGTISPAAGWTVEGKHVKVPICLAPEKSVFIVFRNNGKPEDDPYVDAVTLKQLPPWEPSFEVSDETRLRVFNNSSYIVSHDSGKFKEIEVTGLPEPVELTGPWEVSFQPNRGAPEKVRFEKLMPWNEHSNPGIKYFSGTATSSISFDLQEDFLNDNRQVWLDLGEVAVIAQVRVNGKDFGVLWHKPFIVEVSRALRAGSNTIEVDVTNLWINRLIGDEQYPVDCKWNDTTDGKFPNRAIAEWPQWLFSGNERPVPERVTFVAWKHWEKDDKLRKSGLIGPVMLRCADIISLTSDN